jgi:hypothetical protein
LSNLKDALVFGTSIWRIFIWPLNSNLYHDFIFILINRKYEGYAVMLPSLEVLCCILMTNLDTIWTS